MTPWKGIHRFEGRPDSGHRRDSRHCLRGYVDKGTIPIWESASMTMRMKKTSWDNESLAISSSLSLNDSIKNLVYDMDDINVW